MKIFRMSPAASSMLMLWFAGWPAAGAAGAEGAGSGGSNPLVADPDLAIFTLQGLISFEDAQRLTDNPPGNLLG